MVRKKQIKVLYALALINCVLPCIWHQNIKASSIFSSEIVYCYVPICVIAYTIFRLYGNSHGTGLSIIMYSLSLLLHIIITVDTSKIFGVAANQGSITLPILRMFILSVPLIWFESIQDFKESPKTKVNKENFISAICKIIIIVLSLSILITTINFPDKYKQLYPEISSIQLSFVIIAGLIGSFLAVMRSSYFTFIHMTTMFSCIFSFSLGVFWSISFNYKPAMFLGVHFTYLLILLLFILLIILGIIKNVFMWIFKRNNVVSNIIGVTVKHRHVTSIFLGLMISIIGWYSLFNASNVSLPSNDYNGEIVNINLDYCSIQIPSMAKQIVPDELSLYYPTGNIRVVKKTNSPILRMVIERNHIFDKSWYRNHDPWVKGSLDGGNYKIFGKRYDYNLIFRMEIIDFCHMILIEPEVEDCIKTYDLNIEDQSPKGINIDSEPYVVRKVNWFVSSIKEFLKYYQYFPNTYSRSKGNNQQAYWIIDNREHRPLRVSRKLLEFWLPKWGKISIKTMDTFAASRKIESLLTDRLFLTLQGLFYGQYKISIVSDFEKSGHFGREEISIQIPLIDSDELIKLKTFMTFHFLDRSNSIRNITISFDSVAQNREELNDQLSVWRLIRQSFKYHNSLIESHTGAIDKSRV
jgi:hypothetical protein